MRRRSRALRAENHTVFFDRSALASSEPYNADIRKAIENSHLFVFLISPNSITAGRYTLTELDFAELKWPRPWGYVLSVMVTPTPKADIPPYLRAGTVLQPSGNVAATIAAEIHRIPKSGWLRTVQRYRAQLLVLIALAIVGAGAGWWYQQVQVERAALGRLVRRRSNKITGITKTPGDFSKKLGRTYGRSLPDEAIGVVNDMRLNSEPLPPEDRDYSVRWSKLWNIYYSRMLIATEQQSFFSALAPADHLATFQWLFPEGTVPEDKRDLYRFFVGSFQELAGNYTGALTTFSSLQKSLGKENLGGRLPDKTMEAINRLSQLNRTGKAEPENNGVGVVNGKRNE